MQINESALQRVRSAQLRGEGVALIFEMMAKLVAEGAAAAEFTLGYQKPEDVIQEGDLVPVIVLALRPAVMPAEAT